MQSGFSSSCVEVLAVYQITVHSEINLDQKHPKESKYQPATKKSDGKISTGFPRNSRSAALACPSLQLQQIGDASAAQAQFRGGFPGKTPLLLTSQCA